MFSGDNNQRGSAPNELRQDHNNRLYSQAIRTGLASSSHDNVISKTHQSGNQLQIISQQNLSQSQVTSVRPQGSSMPAPTGQVSGAQQLSVISSSGSQVMQSTPRFANQPQQHQYHNQQQQQQRQAQSHQTQHRNPLLTQRKQQNSVPTNAGVVQQPSGVQNVGPSNLSHSGHQHYYMALNPVQQIQPQIMTSQHMSHAVPYQTHQSRNMHQGMPPPTANYFYFNPQQFNQQPNYAAYAYNAFHTPHGQQTTQMIPQIHPSQRGGQVSAPVMQAPIVQVGSVGANNEMNDMPPQMQQQKQLPKRQKMVAIITDPSSGRNVSLEELASSKNTSINHSEVVSNNDSLSGASNINSNANVDIAQQFATQVAQAATEPLNITETSSVPCDSSEPNDNNNSDTDLTSLVSIETSSNCASNDNLNAEKENIPLNENNLAQNLVDNNNSQNSLNENFEKHDLQQNGETSDLSNQSLNKSDSVKDHQIQKVANSNQRKKEITKKFDNRINSDDLEDETNIKIEPNVNETTSELQVEDVLHVELQASQTASSSVSVMSSEPIVTENDEKSVINENVLNSLSNNSENHVEKKNAENSVFILNDTKTIELIDKDVTKTDLPIKSLTLALPDLPYKEDQWSPVNPDGKRHYDRAFLIAVREKTENTLKMPERLTTMPVDIIRKTHQEFSIADNADPFLPNYANNKTGEYRSNRGLMQSSNVIRRQSQPGKYPDNKRKIISTSLTQDVKLHTTENAWKPTKTNADVIDPEEVETLDLLKKFRGVLNKLTPQKYDALLKQIMTYKIDTEDRLKRVLDLIFDKAVDEPAFCLQYANLCKHLAQSKVTVSKGDSSVPEEVKFQKLLLSKCQKEFETEVYASIEDLKDRQREIEACVDKDKKKAMFEILDEDMRRARKRSLGNIKLIGELYKLHMLKGNIMVQCIDKLCTDKDDESLECLCALLKTIGEQIEEEAANHPKNNYTAVLDSFFDIMDKVANQKISGLNTSSRVRFMLRDLNDMRKNGWKPRRDENMPKMIDEIHQEAKKEEQQRAQDLQQHSIQKRQEERDKRKTGRPNDEWTTIPARKSQTLQPQTHSIDWTVMQKSMSQNHDVQLGPQQSQQWAQGSRGGALSQSKVVTEEKPVNRFSLLESGNADNRKSHPKSNSIPSRDSSKGRSNQHMYSQSTGRRPPSQRADERNEAINLARNFTGKQQQSESMFSNIISKSSNRNAGSREHSAPNSRNSSMRRELTESEPESQLKGNLPLEELELKVKASLKEYLSEKNMEEAATDVKTICNISNVHIYISSAINYALEISSHNDHNAIGNLLCHLVVKQIIKLDQFYKGLHQILEFAEDIELDVPKFWDYIGEIMAPLLIELAPEKRKEFLHNAAKPCIATYKISQLIAKTFSAIAKLTTEAKAKNIWTSSNISWNDYLRPEESVDNFVIENNLQFTIDNSRQPDESELNLGHFSDELQKLVHQKKSKDDIQNFISKYFNVSQLKDPRFTSALFSAVIRGCLRAQGESSFSYTFDSNLYIDIAPLLGKFLGGEPDIELQALIVLQKLMEEMEYPAGLLCQIFQLLYDHAVISHDAFLQWEKCDPSSPGKAVAVASVARFLTWLRENEDDDESDS